jgi:zinc transport system permease protein
MIMSIRSVAMIELLGYDFFIRALLIAISLGISAALLSPYLVLNQQAMIADGLAHVSFTGIILGILFSNVAFYIAIPFVMAASLLIKYLATTKTMNGDAAIGIVSAVSFAIGLILVKTSPGFNISIESMLIGNMFTATRTELTLSFVILVLNAGFILLAYRKLFLLTYDEDYAKFSGIQVRRLSYLIALLTAFFIVVGVRSIGTLLISALIIFPSLIASQWTKSFKNTLLLGIIASLVVVISGIFIAHPLEIPVGSTIVVIYAIILMISIVYKRLKERIVKS